jgi:chromosome segregation ATPase
MRVALLLVLAMPQVIAFRDKIANKNTEHFMQRTTEKNKGKALQLSGQLYSGKAEQQELDQQRAAALENAKNALADVIELVQNMLKEFLAQHEEIMDNWKKYTKWADDAEMEKQEFIMEQKKLVMSTQAQKSSNEQQVQKLAEELATFGEDVGKTMKSIGVLEKMRKEEKAQFEVSLADITKTVAATVKGIEILHGHQATAADLMEVRSRMQLAITEYGIHSPLATQDNVQKLDSLLQTNAKGGEPEPNIVDMLSDLREQLESRKQDLIAKESESQRQYEMTLGAKHSDLSNMKQVNEEKAARKQDREAAIEQCMATLDQAQTEIGDAQGFLKQLSIDRAEATKGHGERITMLKAETGATQAALDALQAVQANTMGTPAASFLQTGLKTKSKNLMVSGFGATSGTAIEVERLIQLGQQIKNTELVDLAIKIKQDYMGTEQKTFFDNSGFGPIMELINNLITQLEEEQAAETSQHEWCNTEKETGTSSQQEREENLQGLKGTVETGTTTIAQLKTIILHLQSEIDRVNEETRVAKEIRASEHEIFVAAKKDHEEVIGAINMAMEAAGQFDGATSALELLQDLLNRYTAALQEIIHNEEVAQKAHDDLVKRNMQFVKETTDAMNGKISERRGEINNLADAKLDMKTNLIELHEVSNYLNDLRSSCDDIRSTYEERKARREAEITALKEALEVISDPSMMG